LAHLDNRINFSRALGAGRRAAARKPSGKLNLETEIAAQVSALTQSPFDPQFGPAPKFVAPDRPDFKTSRGVPFLSELDEAIAGVRGRETATSAGELAGLEGLFEAADPTLRLEKAREFINTIVGPANQAAAIKAGFGRGPAALEATTRAGAELALPIVTEAGRQQGLARQFQVALEQARFSREQSQQRDLLDSVLNKVQAGISIESLNSQERQVLAQFNLSTAGSESQFNLAGAELQSNQEVARSNIGLSTQDRTLNLLNQLRQIRTSQAGINAGLRPGGGEGAAPSQAPRSLGIPSAGGGVSFGRAAPSNAAAIKAGREATADFSRFFSSSAGGLSSGLSSAPGVIPTTSSVSRVASGPIFGPTKPTRKPLNPSAASSPFF